MSLSCKSVFRGLVVALVAIPVLGAWERLLGFALYRPPGSKVMSSLVPTIPSFPQDHTTGLLIERILRHCGLWEGPLRTLTSARGPPGRTPQVPEPRCNLELVLDPKFTAAKVVQSGTHRSRELQLVLDPEFL